jgi:ketosteroid isomerase-like protein
LSSNIWRFATAAQSFDNVDSGCDAGGLWLRLRTLENRGGIVKYGIWLCAMFVFGGITHSAWPRDLAGDEQEIRRVEAELCKAFEDGDAPTLRKDLDPTFTLTNSRGEVSDFAQNLDEVGKREPRYEVFRNHDQNVRLYGDAAIVTGITNVKGRSKGEPFTADFQFTDTYVRRKGRWLLAASHASRLQAK